MVTVNQALMISITSILCVACGRLGFDAAGTDGAGADAAGADAQPTDYVSTVLASSPIAYWRFDEPSGGTGGIARDVSGHGNDAVYSGCTMGAVGALLDDSNTAATFDGAVSNVQGPSFPFAQRASFSIEVWASTSGQIGNQHVASNETATGNRQGYAIFLNGVSTVGFERFVDNTLVIASGPMLTNGRFAHLVGTYDGAELVLYVDGAPAAVAADARPAVGTTAAFTVGTVESTKYFNGTIDELAIYDHVLSADSVAAHYRASGR